LADLAASIERQGVLQPIVVRPRRGQGGQRYEIVAGERRWRASSQAGLAEVPVLVRDLTDEESLAVALVENLQREDLNPLEEAQGYKELMEKLGIGQGELANMVGKSRPAVANTLRLLALDPDAQDDVRAGQLSAGHGRALLALDDAGLRDELRRRILANGLSVREAESQAAHAKDHGSLPDLAPGAVAPRRKGPARKAVAPPPEAVALKERLSGTGFKVKLRGDAERGAMSLAWTSRQELEQLVQKLSGLIQD
jgi:ParB family chromosome partitioning protein